MVKELFNAGADGQDTDLLFADSLSDEQVKQEKDLLPSAGGTVNIDSEERHMTSSTVVASVTLPAGGTQQYRIALSRDGIGWKVSGIEAMYASQSSGSTDASAGSTGTISTNN